MLTGRFRKARQQGLPTIAATALLTIRSGVQLSGGVQANDTPGALRRIQRVPDNVDDHSNNCKVPADPAAGTRQASSSDSRQSGELPRPARANGGLVSPLGIPALALVGGTGTVIFSLSGYGFGLRPIQRKLPAKAARAQLTLPPTPRDSMLSPGMGGTGDPPVPVGDSPTGRA